MDTREGGTIDRRPRNETCSTESINRRLKREVRETIDLVQEKRARGGREGERSSDGINRELNSAVKVIDAIEGRGLLEKDVG